MVSGGFLARQKGVEGSSGNTRRRSTLGFAAARKDRRAWKTKQLGLSSDSKLSLGIALRQSGSRKNLTLIMQNNSFFYNLLDPMIANIGVQ